MDTGVSLKKKAAIPCVKVTDLGNLTAKESRK